MGGGGGVRSLVTTSGDKKTTSKTVTSAGLSERATHVSVRENRHQRGETSRGRKGTPLPVGNYFSRPLVYFAHPTIPEEIKELLVLQVFTMNISDNNLDFWLGELYGLSLGL